MTTGIKHGLLKQSAVRKVTRVMEELNAAACRAMMKVGVSACTDVTGFGLLGHAAEMAAASEVDIEIDFGAVPVMDEAYEMFRAEAIAGGLWTNKSYVSPKVKTVGLGEDHEGVLYDPQTSGGLFISLPERRVDALMGSLRRLGVRGAARIGKVLAKGDGHIVVRG
jgi:selenide,water dikinase